MDDVKLVFSEINVFNNAISKYGSLMQTQFNYYKNRGEQVKNQLYQLYLQKQNIANSYRERYEQCIAEINNIQANSYEDNQMDTSALQAQADHYYALYEKAQQESQKALDKYIMFSNQLESFKTVYNNLYQNYCQSITTIKSKLNAYSRELQESLRVNKSNLNLKTNTITFNNNLTSTYSSNSIKKDWQQGSISSTIDNKRLNSINTKTMEFTLANGSKMFVPNNNEKIGKLYDKLNKTNPVDAFRIKGVYDLNSFKNSLDLQQGNSDILQVGGLYGHLVYQRSKDKQIYEGYEFHHIPSQSLFNEDMKNKLPTIALKDDDHKETASYKGNMNSTHEITNNEIDNSVNYKNSNINMIKESRFIELIKDEILDIRKIALNKYDDETVYDGGIKQILELWQSYLLTNDFPKLKGE